MTDGTLNRETVEAIAASEQRSLEVSAVEIERMRGGRPDDAQDMMTNRGSVMRQRAVTMQRIALAAMVLAPAERISMTDVLQAVRQRLSSRGWTLDELSRHQIVMWWGDLEMEIEGLGDLGAGAPVEYVEVAA